MELLQIAFNVFLRRILIILYEMLIVTDNELTIYGILCQSVTIVYRQKLASLFQVQEKLKRYRNSKWNFLCSCFIAGGSNVKIVRLYVIVFTEYDTLRFWNNVHLSICYSVKVPRNCFNSFNCSNQTDMQVSKFVSTR